MGKHDKKDVFNKALESEGMDQHAWYRERIKTLEQEIVRLKEELIDTKHNLAIMTSLYEQGAESIQRNEARSDEIIERKNEELEMAKEAIYLAAMREVALR